MLKQYASYLLAAISSLTVLIAPAGAATISGKLASESGQAIAGALVTLWNEQKNQKETVYTNADGKFLLDTAFTGAVLLRGRAPYFADRELPMTLGSDSAIEQNLALRPLTTPEEISASLPASAHVSQLPFQSDELRNSFISQCNYCHQ